MVGFRPAQRRRSRLALTLAEREVISRGVTARRSARSIAKQLGRSPSTVSREISRNGGCDRYRATVAGTRMPGHDRVVQNVVNPWPTNSRLRQAVAGKLRLDWSPEQIGGWLKRTHPEDEYNRVSHETILSQPGCPSARRAQERAALPSSIEALDASLQTGSIQMAIDGDISKDAVV